MFDSIFVPNRGQRNPNDYPPDWTLLKRMMWVRMSQIPPTPVYDTVGPDSIVSFNAIHAAALKSLLVTLTPQQDLHGYDNPWPAGGGKNKLNRDNDVVGYYMSQNGTTSANADANYSELIPVTTGATYTFSGKSAVTAYKGVIGFDGSGTYVQGCGATSSQVASGSNYSVTFTVPSGVTQIRATYGKNDTDVMIESGSSATTYAPYSNICPISGFDEVTVEQTGKNLAYMFNDGKVPSITTGELVNAGGLRSDYFRVLPNTEYTLSESLGTKGVYIFYYTASHGFIGYISNTGIVTGTTPANVEYVMLRTELGAENVQFELGSTATDYTAYVGASIPITIPTPPGTVYGGTVDVVTGVLTLTQAGVDMGTLTWDYRSDYKFFYATNLSIPSNSILCSMFKTLPSTKSSSEMATADDCSVVKQTGYSTLLAKDMAYTSKTPYENKTEFTAAVTGQTLVYELAEPVTYQLTTEEVTALVGTNNIWADSGTQVTVEYRSN